MLRALVGWGVPLALYRTAAAVREALRHTANRYTFDHIVLRSVLRVHFKTLLETDGSRARTGRSQQVFPYFGRVPIRTGTWSGGFEMRSK